MLTGVFIVVGFIYFVKALKPLPNHPAGDAQLYFYGEKNIPERAVSTILLPDSTLMTLGWRERYNPNSQLNEYDAVLLKTDLRGRQLRYKIIPNSLGTHLVLTRNDEILALMIEGFSPEDDKSGCGLSIYRFSPQADSIDYRNHDFGFPISIIDFTATSDGCVMFLGSMNSDSTESKNHFLMKLDENGDSLWFKPLPVDEPAVYTTMTSSSLGGFVITGYEENRRLNRLELRLIKVDTEGRQVWTLPENDAINAGGIDIIETDDGCLLVSGSRLMDRNRVDGYLLKFNNQGQLLWDKEIGECGYSSLVGIVPWKDGWLVLGWTPQNESLLKLKTQQIRQWYTYYICILSSEGDIITSFHGGNDFLFPWSITSIDQKYCVITGFGGTDAASGSGKEIDLNMGILHYRMD